MALKRLILAALALHALHGIPLPAANPAPAAPQPAEAAKQAPEDETWTVRRVGGDLEATASWDEGASAWRSGGSVIDTALPVGYPAPTPPGAIELKRYPTVRRAEVTTRSGGDGGFWPLFKHIEREGIPMTSPVERDFPEAGSTEGQRMAFLYRTPEARETGIDPKDPRVVIRDAAPVTVLSIGGRGSYSDDRIRRDAETLYEWMEVHGGWVPAGPPRALLYNGPTLFPGRKWLEVQIPVRPVEVAPKAGEPAAPKS